LEEKYPVSTTGDFSGRNYENDFNCSFVLFIYLVVYILPIAMKDLKVLLMNMTVFVYLEGY
jgi:hypothetical protein